MSSFMPSTFRATYIIYTYVSSNSTHLVLPQIMLSVFFLSKRFPSYHAREIPHYKIDTKADVTIH